MIKLHKSKYWYIIHKKIITLFLFSLYLKSKREKEVPENNTGLIARNITKKVYGLCKEYWKRHLLICVYSSENVYIKLLSFFKMCTVLQRVFGSCVLSGFPTL